VPVRQVYDKLVEVAVSDQDEPRAATIEIAALARQLEQRGIDEQFLVFVRFRCRGTSHLRFLARNQFALSVEGDIADRIGHLENAIDQQGTDALDGMFRSLGFIAGCCSRALSCLA
jgi:hypothetical protein